MNGSSSQRLIEELRDQEFRNAYVAEHIRTGVAYQIKALRDQRGWSQNDLSNRAGKPQSVICRLENPDYGRLSLQTLLDLARAFDVALVVRFVAYSELLEWVSDLRPEALQAVEFANDPCHALTTEPQTSAIRHPQAFKQAQSVVVMMGEIGERPSHGFQSISSSLPGQLIQPSSTAAFEAGVLARTQPPLPPIAPQ